MGAEPIRKVKTIKDFQEKDRLAPARRQFFYGSCPAQLLFSFWG
jgi:hypothetical protein